MIPGEPHDKNGIPIYPGDVLKSFHYRARLRRRNMYLYHVARLRPDGHLEGVPAGNIGMPDKGGTFNLTDHTCSGIEIVQGYGPGKMDDFCDRKRRRN